MNQNALIPILTSKLEQASRRSPFLNCLQGHSSFQRIDLTLLNALQPFIARDILRMLLSKGTFRPVAIPLFEEQIGEHIMDQLQFAQASEQMDEALRGLYTKGLEEIREVGHSTLYVGFPMLSYFDPLDSTKSFFAPLMFWPVTIEPNKSHDEWRIQKTHQGEIRLNTVLRHWLIQQQMKLPHEPSEESLESGSISYAELEAYLVNMAAAFNIPGDWRKDYFLVDTLGPNPFPYRSLSSMNHDGHRLGFEFHLSAVLGYFQSSKEGIIQDLKAYAMQGSLLKWESTKCLTQPDFPFPIVPLDPTQHAAFLAIQGGAPMVVHGPPGTGKSTLLTNLIAGALANGQRVLMISEKRTALNVIEEKLAGMGIDWPIVKLSHPTEDRMQVVSKARRIYEVSKDWKPHKVKSMEGEREVWERLQSRYAQFCEALKRPLPMGMDYETLLAEWAQIAGSTKNVHLSEEAWYSDFSVAQSLPDIQQFLEHYAVDELQKYCDASDHLQWSKEIMSDFTLFDAALHARIEEAESRIYALQKQQAILTQLLDFQVMHDQYCVETSWVRWYKRLFLKERRRHHYLIQQLSRWHPQAAEISGFNFECNKVKRALTEQSHALQRLQGWLLDSATGHACATAWTFLLEKGWFRFKTDLMAVAKEENPFAVFMASWWSFCERKKREELMEHFHDGDMFQALEQYQGWEKLGKERIHQLYQRQVMEALLKADHDYGMKRLYNMRGGKGQRRNSLKQIVATDLSLYLSLFPVTLCTPETASILFQGAEGIFDFVIMDEASQLKVEDVYAAMFKGRSVVIAGDQHQMPPSNWFESPIAKEAKADDLQDVALELEQASLFSESILDYAIHHPSFSDAYLSYHYRSAHPDLIAFSNAAFYGHLKPMTEAGVTCPIHFHDVMGVYHQQTNEQEVGAIVDWLLAIQPDAESRYPSIGVVTLNLKQRDLILKWILKAKRDSAFAQDHFQKLEEAGLFVRNLENIQGDERECIVISTTFGLNENGVLTRQFGKLGTQAGYRLLNVLITRAQREIHVFCSLPAEESATYEQWLREKRGNWGTGLWYAWVEWCRHYPQNKTLATGVLNILRSRCENGVPMNASKMTEGRRKVLEKLRSLFPVDTLQLEAQWSGQELDAWSEQDQCGYWLHFGTTRFEQDHLMAAMHRWNFLIRHGKGVKSLELEVAQRGKMLKD